MDEKTCGMSMEERAALGNGARIGSKETGPDQFLQFLQVDWEKCCR